MHVSFTDVWSVNRCCVCTWFQEFVKLTRKCVHWQSFVHDKIDLKCTDVYEIVHSALH